MKIALDAAAGDHGCAPNIEGAIQAANAWGLEILLVGPAQALRRELAARSISKSDPRFEIVDAAEVIAMGEEPAAACRAKPQASIMVCARLVAEGRAAGLVSAGHSGATMVASLWHLKRIPGVLRPAIAVPVPTLKGATVLLDAGANADCKPWHLVQFAAMGSIYARHILKVERPRVGLLSIGEEETKGNELVKETMPLLKGSGIDFRGPVEGRDIPAGTADVVVCDGFMGNVAVKLMEGMGSMIFASLKAELMSRLAYRLAAQALRGPLGRVRKRMSYDEYGGAPLLGVRGNVIICHGRSNAKAVANALRVARELAETSVVSQIRKAVEALQGGLEAAQARE